MAGRKRSFDVEALCVILKQEIHSMLNESSQLNIPSHPCWAHIAKTFGQGISPKYVYTILRLNRFDVCTKIGLQLATLKEDTDKEKDENENEVDLPTDSISSDTSTDGSTNCSDSVQLKNKLNFQITLSPDEWAKIQDSSTYVRGDRSQLRKYKILKPFNWTTIINEHFYELTKRTCCIVYKRCKIYPNGTTFLRLQGQCKSCQSVLVGVVYDTPKSNHRVIVNCTYLGDHDNCRTSLKRRILGENRNLYLQKLVTENKSASFIQKEDACKMMNYGDLEPSHLPTLNALRVMKNRAKSQMQLHEDPIMAVIQLKSCAPYNEIIRDVGYDHFYVHYWSSFQLSNYRLYARHNTVPCISIDATGGVVQPVNLLSDRKTKPIFLYEIAVLDKFKKSQFSVGEMLSEAHDNHSIAYWLSRWLMNRIPGPKIVVTDMSRALMMGCVKAFTQYSTLAKYLDVCWLLLDNKDGAECPSCMIRNDFAHIMHLISTWPEIKLADSSRCKKFYLRSIALVIASTDYEAAKLLLKYIFIICLSETEGCDDFRSSSSCESAINYLKARISGLNPEIMEYVEAAEIDDPDEINNDCEGTLQDMNDDDNICNKTNEIQRIYNKCLETSETNGNRVNPFYKPNIAKRLLKLCDLLPVWSAIMVPIFGFGTITHSSTSSESLFKELKKDAFQHEKLPMRVDSFLEKHINVLSGATILVGSKYFDEVTEENHTKITKKNDTPKNDVNTDDNKDVEKNSDFENNKNTKDLHIIDEGNADAPNEYAEEDWRGLNSSSQKTKPNYLDSDPSIIHQNITKSKSPIIGLIRNGSSASLNAVKIGAYFYVMSNTCPFDSVAQVEFVAYADSSTYSTYVDSHHLEMKFFELIKNGIRDGITVQLYKRRAIILTHVFDSRIEDEKNKMPSSDLINISADTTIKHLLKTIFYAYPSFCEEKQCSHCHITRTRSEVIVTVNLPTDNLAFFEKAIEKQILDSKKCDHCGHIINRSSRKINFGPHLFIEPAPSLQYLQNTADDLKTELKDIPESVTILTKRFFLRGVIHFNAPKSKRPAAIGHYVAYCYRQNSGQWQKYDDLDQHPKTVRPSTTIAANCIFYSQ